MASFRKFKAAALAVLVSSSVASGGVAGRLNADEKDKAAGPQTQVAVTVAVDEHLSETRVVLAELTRLRQPVQVRVTECERDLVAARRDVVAALRHHEVAKNEASDALGRVEAVACVLRTMCQTLEVNGSVYSKEQVAESLRKLILKYRSAADAVEASADQLECRTATLRQVATRVVKWRKQEQALLEQVAALKAGHGETENAGKAASAAKLVAEVTEMLAKPAVAGVAVDIKVSSANQTAPLKDKTPAVHPNDRLLKEVDDILSEKPAIKPR